MVFRFGNKKDKIFFNCDEKSKEAFQLLITGFVSTYFNGWKVINKIHILYVC